MLARPAAGVEKCAGECAFVRQADKGRLWAAYVPRRRRAGIGVVPVVRRVGCGHEAFCTREPARLRGDRGARLVGDQVRRHLERRAHTGAMAIRATVRPLSASNSG